MFDTIAAESQRLINETYSAFVQGFMPTLARPDVDVLDGLTTAIIVDPERIGANARSTVGTVTDANAMLRILFSRLGQPHIGSPSAYSFNVPSVRASGAITVERGAGQTHTKKATFNRLGGMCPRCEGMGWVTDFDLSALYDDSLSMNEGAITIPGYSMDGRYGLDEPSVAPLLATLGETLDSFVEIGLGYLSLDRPSGTLWVARWHGESCRVCIRLNSCPTRGLVACGLSPSIEPGTAQTDAVVAPEGVVVDQRAAHRRRFVPAQSHDLKGGTRNAGRRRGKSELTSWPPTPGEVVGRVAFQEQQWSTKPFSLFPRGSQQPRADSLRLIGGRDG